MMSSTAAWMPVRAGRAGDALRAGALAHQVQVL
jgi:hypothetical protein